LRHGVAYVFILIGVLMLGHLFLIYMDVMSCLWIIKLRIDEVGPMAATVQDLECRSVEEAYQEAVDKYLAIALALAGGGATGIAIGRTEDKK
jgi:hypothetical protein